MTSSIQKVVDDFRDAEAALRALADQVNTLKRTESRVDIAWASLEQAGEALGASQETLAGLINAIDKASIALGESSAELQEVANALLALDQERIIGVGEQTRVEVQQLNASLREVVEARTSAVTDAVVATVRSASSDHGSQLRTVTATMEETARALAALDTEVNGLARRQLQTLIAGIAAALFAAAAVVLVFVG